MSSRSSGGSGEDDSLLGSESLPRGRELDFLQSLGELGMLGALNLDLLNSVSSIGLSSMSDISCIMNFFLTMDSLGFSGEESGVEMGLNLFFNFRFEGVSWSSSSLDKEVSCCMNLGCAVKFDV